MRHREEEQLKKDVKELLAFFDIGDIEGQEHPALSIYSVSKGEWVWGLVSSEVADVLLKLRVAVTDKNV